MRLIMILVCIVFPALVQAQDNGFRLALPDVLVENGFAQYLLPRFFLKHGVRIVRVGPDDAADARLGDAGQPVFSGLGRTWAIAHDGHAGATLFADWLQSDVGRNTVAAFELDGATPFQPYDAPIVAADIIQFEGDAARGAEMAIAHCGRCHVINETNRMKGMGATPSFGMLRTLNDWENRFATFYVLNPHPSFSQIAGITLPFDPSRPPPIVPLEITQSDLDDIMSYVATLPPADLGAPIQLQ